jgi:hypothetical protein
VVVNGWVAFIVGLIEHEWAKRDNSLGDGLAETLERRGWFWHRFCVLVWSIVHMVTQMSGKQLLIVAALLIVFGICWLIFSKPDLM